MDSTGSYVKLRLLFVGVNVLFLRLLQSFFRRGDLNGDFAGDVFFTELIYNSPF